MALVATINGKQVFSDKRVMNIIGTRIEFMDGSWCDVSTGAVANRGAGFIDIGAGDSSDEKKVTKAPERFQTTSLDVRQVTADVTVEVHDGSDMEVSIVGPSDLVDDISTNARGGTLIIEGRPRRSSQGVSISTRGGRTVVTGSVIGGVVMGGGSLMQSSFGRFGSDTTIITSSGSQTAPVQVRVKVPRGSSVSISDIEGNANIGDTNGPLTLHLMGGGDVNAGSITNLSVTVQGSSDTRVARVNGAVSVQIQGSGDVDIDDGNMSSLNVSVQGSGDVTIGGSADTASLTVMGSGDIKVARVRQRPMERVMGSGGIRVRRVG